MPNSYRYYTLVLNILFLLCNFYTIHWVVVTRRGNNILRNWLIGLQISNIPTLVLAIVSFFVAEEDSERAYAGIAGAFSMVTVLGVSLINCNILQAFSVISLEISDVQIARWKTALVVIYIVLCTPLTLFIVLRYGFGIVNSYYFVGGYLNGLYALLMILYDNVQAIYLTFKIHQFVKSAKHQDIMGSLKRTLAYIISICVVDWIGMSVYTYCMVDPDIDRGYFEENIANLSVSFHSCLISLVFLSMKELALKKSRGRRTAKETVLTATKVLTHFPQTKQ
ncbi:hypothetical protein HDU91_000032 [Kappamyces sp. JEL0680]|nr:hypothetical protein HDU91_000032 [Kappamyces sp. JEL0680]